MPDDHILKILLQYANDPAALSGAAAGANQLQTSLKGVQTQAASTVSQLQQIRAVARELNQVATITIAAGTAIAGPFLAAAAKYVAATRDNDTASSQWLATLGRISKATDDIGRVAAEAILPELQQAASLAEKVATFLEANPGVVDAALKIGATAIVVGTVEKAVAEGIRMYADINLISAAALQNTAADKMLAAAQLQVGAASGGSAGGAAATGASFLSQVRNFLLGSIGAAAPYLGAGSAVDQAQSQLGIGFGSSQFQSQNNPSILALLYNLLTGNSAAQGTPLGPTAPNYYDNPAYAGLDASDRDRYRNTPGSPAYTPPPSEYQTALAKAQPAYDQFAKSSAANLDNLESQQLATRLNYLKQSEQAEKAYNDNRARQIRDFNEQSAQIEKQYNDARRIQLRDFNEQQAQAQQSFDESNAKAAAAHSTDLARLAQDYADQEKQKAATHAQTLHDLAAAGDALGYVKEQENYAKQQATDKANYDKEVARRNQDYATQQADAKKAYDEQRAQALANFQQAQDDAAKAYQDQKDQRAFQFQQQLNDAQTAFNDQQAQAANNFQTTLDDQQAAYNQQEAQLKKAFTDQLNAIDPILTGMTKSVQTNMQAASDQFALFLKGVQSQIGGGPGYCGPGYHWDAQLKACVADAPAHFGSAAGGYVGYGMRLLGEQGQEFVMSNPTTRAAERLVGGPLTHERILAGLSRSNSYAVNLGGIAVNGGGRADVLAQVLGLVDSRITDAFTQFADSMAGGL